MCSNIEARELVCLHSRIFFFAAIRNNTIKFNCVHILLSLQQRSSLFRKAAKKNLPEHKQTHSLSSVVLIVLENVQKDERVKRRIHSLRASVEYTGRYKYSPFANNSTIKSIFGRYISVPTQNSLI